MEVVCLQSLLLLELEDVVTGFVTVAVMAGSFLITSNVSTGGLQFDIKVK